MPTSNRIISASIDWDEDACLLTLEHEGDGYVNVYILNDPEQLYDAVKGGIGSWLRERDEARALYEVTAFKCDPDESGGYDVSDPKHPAFHSTHADIWDNREGK